MFLVVWSIGLPNHPNGLDKIPNPPGSNPAVSATYPDGKGER